jgi:hypothetical protein
MAKLTWYGDRIAARTEAAAVLGTDATMSACVTGAKTDHPWRNRTGYLEGSTRIIEPATAKDDKVSGRWGSVANYALFLEIGTSRPDSGFPRADVRAAAAGGNMNEIGPPSDPALMVPRPFLRPQADIEYKLHRARVGAAFRGEDLP